MCDKQIIQYKNFIDTIPNYNDFLDGVYSLIFNMIMLHGENKKGIIIDNFNYTFQDWCLFSIVVQCTQMLKKPLLINCKKKNYNYINKMKKYNSSFKIIKSLKNDNIIFEDYLIVNSYMLHDFWSKPSNNLYYPFENYDIDIIYNLSEYFCIPKTIYKKMSRKLNNIKAFYVNYNKALKKN